MEERDASTAEPAAEPQVQTDESPMGRLRELRRKSREQSHLTLEVPGFEGEFGIRYKSVPRDELKKIYGNGKKDDIDLLIYLAESAVVKNGEEFEDLKDEKGIPLQFDSRLAEYLELDSTGARECVERVFSLDLYPLSTSRHVKRLVSWMEGVDVKADEDFLGE